ncbi:MAG: MotA/TolQ/ExbB proton channel family protein [Methyloligellaceae bacterium]
MLSGRTHRALSKPRVYLLWMFFFLAAIGFLASILYPQIRTAFWGNPGLNGVIIGVLAFGVLFSFSRITRLYPEIKWVNTFRVSNPGSATQHMPALLAPMATLLRDKSGPVSLSTNSMGAMMDSIASRLDESRETSRYMIGLLVFLGLLGTFWGLLVTIQSINDVIGGLSSDTGNVLTKLQEALKGPLDGMGLAFSSSLFGLSGSLILGFLDLQASQAQSRFYNELEEWLSGITQISTDESPAGDNTRNELKFAILDMQRSMAELGDRIQYGIDSASGRSDEAAKELARGIDNLVKQMRAEQKVVREWVDEQASHTSDLNMVLRELTSRLGGGGRRG